MTAAEKRVSTRSFCAVLLMGLALVIPSFAAGPARVVAIGDIHGDLQNFKAMLREAAIIDAEGRWIAGSAVVVQTGDTIDRGPESRGVLDFVANLEKQADRSGGKVIAMLGNHEVMNIMGDLRYVAAEDWASFTDAKSPARRQEALERYKNWLGRRGTQPFTPEMEAEWLKQHPPGFVEQRAAFGPQGRYGKWLRRHLAAVQVGDTIFVHGGINPSISSLSAQEISRRVTAELALFDAGCALLQEKGAILPFFTFEEITEAARQVAERLPPAGLIQHGTTEEHQAELLQAFLEYPHWLSINRNGPLWFRGFAEWSEDQGAAPIDTILQAHHATRLVVGHTFSGGTIRARWNNKVFLIDTGLLQSPRDPEHGHPSALEIVGSQVTAIYEDRRETLAPVVGSGSDASEPILRISGGGPLISELQLPVASAESAPRSTWLGADGKPLPFKNDAEILEFLRTAKVVKEEGIPLGITGPLKLTLEKNGIRAHAVFRKIDEESSSVTLDRGQTELFFRDSYLFEPAAYELSRLLGMDNIPPTTLRRYQGQPGSIQIWVENAITETARHKKKKEPPDLISWSMQVHVKNVWDQLVYNTDRNTGNMLITPDWKMWLIDHTRAFRRIETLLDEKKIVQCDRGVYERLRALNERVLQQRLSPYLRKPEIAALLKRRDRIMKRLDASIREKGEGAVLFTLPAAAAPVKNESAVPEGHS